MANKLLRKKVSDRDIRTPLLKSLEKEHGNYSDTRIIEELGLCQGSARVDVAVVNGYLHGYEIKSESDSLKRLPAQVDYYSKVLDRVTLVASESHISKVEKLIPDWWGVCVAQRNRGTISLKPVRGDADNSEVDPYALVQLLWRDEALNILRKNDLAKGYSNKPRRILWDRLVDHFSLSEMKQVVRRHLKFRSNWRVD